MPTQPQLLSYPTGSPIYTWVKSSNVDKQSVLLKDKSIGRGGNRTRALKSDSRVFTPMYHDNFPSEHDWPHTQPKPQFNQDVVK